MENFTKRFLLLFLGALLFFSLAFGSIVFFNSQELSFAGKMISALRYNVIVWIIIVQFSGGCLMLIKMFFNTVRESKFLEKIIEKKGEYIIEGEFGSRFSQSFFANHFKKIASAQHFRWSKKSREDLNDYLENQLFFSPKLLETMASLLPAWGMLGTVLGLAQALETKSRGGDLYLGVAIALGTTILGLIGNLFLYSLNKIISDERNSQLKTMRILINQDDAKEGVKENES